MQMFCPGGPCAYIQMQPWPFIVGKLPYQDRTSFLGEPCDRYIQIMGHALARAALLMLLFNLIFVY